MGRWGQRGTGPESSGQQDSPRDVCAGYLENLSSEVIVLFLRTVLIFA